MKPNENYFLQNRRSVFKISENSGLKNSISPYIFISKAPVRPPTILTRKKSHFRSFSLFCDLSLPKSGVFQPKKTKNRPAVFHKKTQVTPLVPAREVLAALGEFARLTLGRLNKEEYSFAEILHFLEEKGITLFESDFETQKMIKTFLETSRRQMVFDEIVRVFDEGGISMKGQLEKAFAVAIGKKAREKASSSSLSKKESDFINEASLQAEDVIFYDTANDSEEEEEGAKRKERDSKARSKRSDFKWNLDNIKEVDFTGEGFQKEVDFCFIEVDFEMDCQSELNLNGRRRTLGERG